MWWEGNHKTMTASQEITTVRCVWAKSELNIPYHDEEWGVPVHDEHKWFEFLVLEGAQAGLSWDTILRKRARYREVFDGFDPEKVARYDKKKVRELLRDPRIRRPQQRPPEARLSLRRLNHLLRPHASDGNGERSSGELFPVWRFVEIGMSAGLTCVYGKASLR